MIGSEPKQSKFLSSTTLSLIRQWHLAVIVNDTKTNLDTSLLLVEIRFCRFLPLSEIILSFFDMRINYSSI